MDTHKEPVILCLFGYRRADTKNKKIPKIRLNSNPKFQIPSALSKHTH